MTATTLAPADRFDMAAAPMRIGRVRLAVRDLERVSGFYRDALGLVLAEDRGETHLLGAGGTPFLELHGDPALQATPRGGAGLFHTAFLLPARADLGRWLAFAAQAGLRVQGASDHKVSEAVYLADPEGNGIEIYADRPPAGWTDSNGDIEMSTDPLDVESLLAEAAGTRWAGAPAGTIVGHVHLQVGDTAEAERFYAGLLGFDIAKRYPGASFFGSGGYHHQLAGNIWNSRGAPPRKPGHAGLEMLEIVVGDGERLEALAEKAAAAGLEAVAGEGELRLDDPWGTRVLIRAG
ncbi:VOC family protein [Stappia sp. MMSF_3263]|uniref:VOC family protein n=1 Tax=Stappia sp. MMSF_3263 TaxID=3046693 RepID=UPI00273F2D7D|nr:VOC family protein [Stappia sp. MMSF_3263]